jgi:hypothetical protein
VWGYLILIDIYKRLSTNDLVIGGDKRVMTALARGMIEST